MSRAAHFGRIGQFASPSRCLLWLCTHSFDH
jgi:hypothetical protein